MSAPRPPRRLIHRGVVEAAALLVEPPFAGAKEARRRVLSAWSLGAIVHRAGAALLIRFPAPRSVDCARAPGLPLVRAGSDAAAPLCSAPLLPDELAAAAPPPGAAVIVRGGAVTVFVPSDADREDPARWIDLDAFAIVEAAPLGPAPRAPEIVGAPTNVAARALLGVGEPPPDMAMAAAALAALHAGRAPPGGAPRGGDEGGFALSLLGTLIAAVGAILGRLFRVRGAPSGSSAGGRAANALAAAPAEPAGPSFAERLAARLRHLAASLLVRARLAHLVGRRQAEYLGRLLDMLDRGDLDAALRHAIPLGGSGGGASEPALGVPAPRSDLTISMRAKRGGAAMVAATDLYQELRARYRAAFEKLERAGRIDEAAFVLAELLQESEEAVSFLERHGRLKLAAELAEARRLPAGLVVRQWFLAGEVARAVLIARRNGAFHDAIARLGQHTAADALRLRWADTLAAAGDYAQAVELAWTIEEARALVMGWIERAVAQGGAAGARMLVKMLAADPRTFAAVRAQVLALVEEQGAHAASDRLAFADALAGGAPSIEAKTLARAAIRALVADAAQSGDPRTATVIARLVGFADDAAVRADMPAWPTVARQTLAQIEAPRSISVAAADAGAVPILDLAHLPGGRVALALGEAGVRVLGRHSRPIFHLDQPAHRLVISDRGDRAIALAPRGAGRYRLARIDLAGRRTEAWCDAAIDAFAPDFDGSQWVVARGDRVHVIDALDTSWSALHELEPGARVLAVGRRIDACTAVCARPGLPFRVRWAPPAWVMRERETTPPDDQRGRAQLIAAAAGGGAAYLLAARFAGDWPLLTCSKGAGNQDVALPWPEGAVPCAIVTDDTWVACAARWDEGVEVRLVDHERLTLRAQIELERASSAALRLGHGALAIGDDRGRVLVIDLAHGGLLHDVRL